MDSRVTGAVECLNWLSQPEAIGLVSSGHHPDLAQAIRRLCDVYSDRVQQASLIAKPKSLGNDAGPASTSTPPSLEAGSQPTTTDMTPVVSAASVGLASGDPATSAAFVVSAPAKTPIVKPPLYSEGEAVEANFRNKGGWYPATIKVARINNGGTRVYNLAYFDGDVERGVPERRIRPRTVVDDAQAADVSATKSLPEPVPAAARVRVWETRKNLPPALRELLSFNSKGMSDDWDVIETRKRKQTSLYEAGPSSGWNGSATGSRKGRGPGSGKRKRTDSLDSAGALHTPQNDATVAQIQPQEIQPAAPSSSLGSSTSAPARVVKKPPSIAPGAAPPSGNRKGGRVVYTCRHCGRNFNHVGNCRSHEATHLAQVPLPTPIPTNDPALPHGCEKCGKGFARISDLNIHFRHHTNDGRKPLIVDVARTVAGSVKAPAASTAPASQPPAQAQGLLACCICQKTFTDGKDLQLHEAEHAKPAVALPPRAAQSPAAVVDEKRLSPVEPGAPSAVRDNTPPQSFGTDVTPSEQIPVESNLAAPAKATPNSAFATEKKDALNSFASRFQKLVGGAK